MDDQTLRGSPLKKTKKIEAGSDIESRCLKCKDVTNHTVFAMVEGKVAKVECNVCGARHKYRPEKPVNKAAEKRKATRAATIASAKLAKTEAFFDELIAGRKPSEAKAYGMAKIFKKDDLLDHPAFGLGVVVETVMPDKIEVQFRQENKLLICGRMCS